MSIQIFNKTAAVLLILVVAFSGYCDFNEQKRIKIDRIRNSLSFVDLIKLESGDYVMERALLKKYLEYFLAVSKNNPKQADALAMAGFCYFHLGDLAQATSSYQRAASLNPEFFWFHYNLAALLLLQNRYEDAIAEFKTALAVKPQESILFFRKSKIFIYIIYKAQGFNVSLVEKLKEGYALSNYYVGECLKKSPQPQIRLRIF